MHRRMRITTWGAVALAVVGVACSRDSKREVGLTPPTEKAVARPPITRIHPGTKARSLEELRQRNPMRWVGDSVQSVMRGYRADYVARRKAKLPVKGLCEGLEEYFTTRNSWGRSLGNRAASSADLLSPKCGTTARKIRFFSAAFHRFAHEGEAYLTGRSLGLVDSLQKIAARVDAANRPTSEGVSTLTAEIDRIENLAASSSLTDQEYEFVMAATSGLTGAIAEAQSIAPAIMQDISSAVDECLQRLGHAPSDPADCDREVYEAIGPVSYRLPKPVLMCVIATKSPTSMAIPTACDGHEIIEGITYGFIGGAIGGAWAGLLGTGGLGVPLTALLGGIGGAISGLGVGLAKTIWCEINSK